MMSKFRKWIVGISLSLLLLGGIALSICYILIPQRTKDAIDIVIGYLNTPYGLGCGITITGSLVIYLFAKYLIKYAISNSKYGKGELVELKKRLLQAESKASDYENKAEQLDFIVKDNLSNFNERIDYLADYLTKVCETSPNVKIKALGKDLVGGYDEKKVELNESLDKISQDYTNFVDENKTINEIMKKLNDLESKVASYETKETTND